MVLCLRFIMLKLPWCLSVHMLHEWLNTVQTLGIISIAAITLIGYCVFSNSKSPIKKKLNLKYNILMYPSRIEGNQLLQVLESIGGGRILCYFAWAILFP